MEIERYRALMCAIDSGSLTAAAGKLQYTLSGISRMVAALEEELGFALLLREHGGVRPTAECERLMGAFRELLYTADNCAQLASGIRGLEIGSVTVGAAYAAFYAPLARASADFHARFPGILVQLRSGYSSELLGELNARRLDLAMISRREGGHDWLPLFDDAMTAWVPASHPLAALPALPVEEFAREAYIETYPDADIDNTRVFARCGVKPNLQFSTQDSYATYSMVEAGLGLSMNNAVNGRLWSGGVKILPLDPPQYVEIGIASRADASPAAKRFLDFLRPYLVNIH